MSSFLWHVIVDPTANRLHIADADDYDLYSVRFDYSYQGRHPAHFAGNGQSFFRGWPSSKGMCNGDNSWMFGLDASTSETDGYEPSNVMDGGTYRPWFIRGRCTDNNGAALAACDVEVYTAVTDIYQSKGITDQNGYYMLPVQFGPGTSFIVYANYANGTYVGATVATVQSAL